MSNDLEDIFNDAQVAPSDADIKQLSDLIMDMKQLGKDIEAAEAELAVKAERYRKMVETQIPDMMISLGIRGLPLADGTALMLKDIVAASIKVSNRLEAYAWLKDNGFADMIKKNFEVQLGKDTPPEHLEKFMGVAKELGYLPEVEEKVEPATLTAFVRRRLEEGAFVPKELFGVYQGRKAVIEQPKVKRRKS